MFVFFFQAEDGIRDYDVTGVQTCALPIYRPLSLPSTAVASQGVKLQHLARCRDSLHRLHAGWTSRTSRLSNKSNRKTHHPAPLGGNPAGPPIMGFPTKIFKKRTKGFCLISPNFADSPQIATEHRPKTISRPTQPIPTPISYELEIRRNPTNSKKNFQNTS